MKVIICYDIEDDKQRRKLVKYLESFAYRLQYSVFECELSAKELTLRRFELQDLLQGIERPKFTMITLCNDCVSKIWQLGTAREEKPRQCIIL